MKVRRLKGKRAFDGCGLAGCHDQGRLSSD
jgi:hypothetical protein